MSTPDADAYPPVVVIGAGPSGLASAAMLRRAGVPATVIERSSDVGASWRGHYDHLRLHTTRFLSALPGLPLPRSAGRWVGRDAWVAYLEDYVQHHDLDIRTHTTVRRLEPVPIPTHRPGARSNPASHWTVRLEGEDLLARAVVVATGRNHTPHIPAWPGRSGFTGQLMHSNAYRNPDNFKGRSVLVAGAGNSGTEIAAAIAVAGAAEVWLSVRTPPTIVPCAAYRWQLPGIWIHRLPPAVGDKATTLLQRLVLPDLARKGLPRPSEGMYTRSARTETNPVLDRGIIKAIRTNQVVPVAAVEQFDGPQVTLADGTSLTPDVCIAATGYRAGLEPLLNPLPLLDAAGQPTVRGSETSAYAPHLYFAGYSNPLSGALRQAGIDARHIARAVKRGRPTQRPTPLRGSDGRTHSSPPAGDRSVLGE